MPLTVITHVCAVGHRQPRAYMAGVASEWRICDISVIELSTAVVVCLSARREATQGPVLVTCGDDMHGKDDARRKRMASAHRSDAALRHCRVYVA